MSKIQNQSAYPNKNPITDLDYLVGTNGDTNKLETKSFNVSDFRNYITSGFSPTEGGSLRIEELLYSGSYTTPEDVLNFLYPNIVIAKYHILIVIIDELRYMFKLQNREVGATAVAVTSDDFILLNPQQVFVPNNATNVAQGVIILAGDLAGTYSAPTVPALVGKAPIVHTHVVSDVSGLQGALDLKINNNANQSYAITLSLTSFVKIGGTSLQILMADGSVLDVNLQKIITANYTISNADNRYTIIVKNSVSNVTITAPIGLQSKIEVGFIRDGLGDVTFNTSGGAIIKTAVGLKINKQYDQAYLLQDLATNTYYLLGNLKV